MIPYDDLVAALSAWRARQGLPVSTMGGTGSGGTPSPGSGPHGQTGSGPYAQAGSGPHAQTGSGPYASASQPGMAAMTEEVVDAEELDAEAYEAEGSYDAGNNDVEPTSIGSAPERPTETDMGGGGRDDW